MDLSHTTKQWAEKVGREGRDKLQVTEGCGGGS